MTRKERAAAFLEEGYNITVTGRHVMVTDAMKDYAIEKVSKIERFTDRILEVVITMDIQKLDHRVDITMKVNHIKIKSSAISSDMYVSIDMAVHKIETQLLKYKQKLQDHQTRAVSEIDMRVNVIRPKELQELDEVNDAIIEESLKAEDSFSLVPDDTRAMRTLTVEEAIMKMDLSQDAFLIFKEIDDQKVKVLYRRTDGNYGLIEPES